MKYDTVLFDLDGTLLNTLTDLAQSINKMLAAAGYPERTEQQIRASLGNGAKMLVWTSLPEGTCEAEVERCLEQYRPIYKQNMSNNTRPYEGIMELLEALKQRGIKMGVVSNKPDAPCKALVDEMFGGYIDVAIGDKPEVPRKPDRAAVDSALSALGAKHEGAIYIGDSEVDIMTARNAGLPCVCVTWGFRDRDVFEEEGADFIIDHPSELLALIYTNSI